MFAKSVCVCVCVVCVPTVICQYMHVLGNVHCVVFTDSPHSAQVKETRRSLCDSESGVKKMAMGHHLGECSHTIE